MAELPLIGVLPAAGIGSRLAPLPMSKELFPLGFRSDHEGQPRPKVAAHFLLEKMRRAGVEQAFWVLRPGKWDIPAYFGDGGLLDMRLAYLTVSVPFGVPFSLDQAYPFVKDAVVAMGFPDLLFEPGDAFVRMRDRLFAGKADVVVGLFPTDQPQNVGVVEFDAKTGQVFGLYEKSSFTHLPFMWAIALWKPRFTEFLHGFVGDRLQQLLGTTPPHAIKTVPPYQETPIGDVIHASLSAGLRVEAEVFDQGWSLDIGIPQNLATAIQTYGTLEGLS